VIRRGRQRRYSGLITKTGKGVRGAVRELQGLEQRASSGAPNPAQLVGTAGAGARPDKDTRPHSPPKAISEEGLDAKNSCGMPSPSDGQSNTDFSQVETDESRRLPSISAFEVFFPEKTFPSSSRKRGYSKTRSNFLLFCGAFVGPGGEAAGRGRPVAVPRRHRDNDREQGRVPARIRGRKPRDVGALRVKARDGRGVHRSARS